MAEPMVLSDAEWRRRLNGEQYRILRERSTELPFTGAYWDCHDAGAYRCAGCGHAVFDAAAKFDSGTGWPSFWAPAGDESVTMQTDGSFGMRRTEVSCARCGSHLGHVFGDGPAPTGLRYCINSAALRLDRAQGEAQAGTKSPQEHAPEPGH